MQLTGSKNPGRKNLSVLVADDNNFTLKSIYALLMHYGHKVSPYNNTDDVMSALHNNDPDIVLINVNANELSCIELLGKIRNHDQDIPVILMVDAANITMAIHAVKNGAFDIIPKPYTPEELIGYLKKADEHCSSAMLKNSISYK